VLVPEGEYRVQRWVTADSSHEVRCKQRPFIFLACPAPVCELSHQTQ